MALVDYPLALLQLMINQEKTVNERPLGTAKRIGTDSSEFEIPAHRFLHALIRYSLSQETIAKEFLVELKRCEDQVVEKSGTSPVWLSYLAIMGNFQVQALLDNTPNCSAETWANAVNDYLRKSGGNISYLTKLGSHYLTHLVIGSTRIYVLEVCSPSHMLSS